jgi:hypothetical protein
MMPVAAGRMSAPAVFGRYSILRRHSLQAINHQHLNRLFARHKAWSQMLLQRRAVTQNQQLACRLRLPRHVLPFFAKIAVWSTSL